MEGIASALTVALSQPPTKGKNSNGLPCAGAKIGT